MGLLFFALFSRPGQSAAGSRSPGGLFYPLSAGGIKAPPRPLQAGAFLLSPGAKYAILYNDNFDSEVTER